ncbi:hypothetical protein Q0P04_14580, partial [Staphylococcus aureus]|nr:hypothetical protein [Staphylococcus aureus]
EFTHFFVVSNQLNYLKFVFLRFHCISKRKIFKMYNFAYFRILEVCDMAKKNDFRFNYQDYKFLIQYVVSNTFICMM